MKQFLLFNFLLIVTLIEGYAQFSNHRISNRAYSVVDVDVADIDGDGNLDVLSASRDDGTIAWYQNDGNGRIEVQFVLQRDIPFTNTVHATDIDQDGDIDVIPASYGFTSGEILLYTNIGNGSFEESKVIVTGEQSPSIILSADINKDGKMDIIIGSGSPRGLYWCEQLEDNTFGSANMISGDNNPILHVDIADIEGDGDIDLVSSFGTDGSKGISIFINHLNDGFEEVNVFNVASQIIGGRVEFAYINNDEYVDIVHVEPKEKEIIWFAGEGNGNFGTKQVIQSDFPDGVLSRFCLLDFNKDGSTDICFTAAYSSSPAIHFLSNDGSGNFTFYNSFPNSNPNTTELLIADFNNDGSDDILRASITDMTWRPNDGSANWEEEKVITSNNKHPFFAQGMDVDRDGDLDIIGASSTDAAVVWYENFGYNTFGSAQVIHYAESTSNRPTATAIMDLDMDGSEDVVVALGEGESILWYSIDNQGNMTERGAIENASLSIEELSQVDLDQDGNMDLLTVDSNDRIVWYRNKGNAQFETGIVLINFQWSIVGSKLTDVNQDGNQDLILFNTWSRIVQWFEGKGDGTFSEGTLIVDGSFSIRGTQIEDIDLDGNDDIVYINDSGNLTSINSNGNGTWLPPSLIYDFSALSLNLEKIVDLNGDGLKDLIFEMGSDLYFSLQIGLGEFLTPIKISNDGVGKLFIVDLDQDGDIDLLNCNSNIQSIIWHENELHTENQLINGFVFMDLNENGLKDDNEFGLANQRVILGPKGGMFFTNNQGSFGFFASIDQYGLAVFPDETWRQTSSPETYVIDLIAGSAENPYNFGLLPLRPITRVEPYLNSSPTRCSTTANYWLHYSNTGTTIANGTITLELDELMSLVSSNPEPDLIEGRNLIWYFEDLHPSFENKIELQFQMPDFNSMGEILETQATVQLFNDNQELIYSKSTDNKSEIRCSYDPNDKLARSNLLGQSEFAYLADTILYTVRFQNTGNDTAFNIRIEDILDKKLDWITFHPITASHDYRTELNRETGLVTFHFDDIMLPDSTTDKEGSNGFVMFGIASLPDLQDKIEVDNTASIFFDFNPPIITNTATLTLIEQVETNIETLNANYSIRVFPNPFSDYTTIEVNGLFAKGNYRLEVMDILGRKVRELKIENGKVRLERRDLENGLYLIRVLTDENRVLGSEKVLVK